MLATPGSTPSAGVDPAAIGRAFVDALARGDAAAAEAMEDATMRAAAPAGMLSQLWQQLEGQMGAFRGLGAATTKEQAPYTIATVEAEFANATLPLLVTVTGDGLVAGFHLGQPAPAGSPGASAQPSASPTPASYVRPGSFTETDVAVGAEPWALPGTLAMPTGSGPFPAVVLVAGSGPQDRDEAIGPNAPLRDLAWGLASAGIAVLRYDKRTKVHAAEMASHVADVTVREETIDDAVAAVGLLRRTSGVDPSRVFLAGHSLGGYLAPRIAAAVQGELAGIALLEANSTPLPRLILDQVEYLASVQASPNPHAGDQLAALRAQVALAEAPDLAPSTPASDLPLGIPAAYWLDLRSYDPLATARAGRVPMFFSQGGRDYQVPPSELAAWRTALAGRDDIVFHAYPTLNHLLMAGTGSSTPAEYTIPGHVAPELVADLGAWILEH
jgi:dienelactone hydrolase